MIKPTRQPPLQPVDLGPPPVRPPRQVRSTADLRSFQRFMAHTLVQPLTKDDAVTPRWRDGRPIAEVAAEFIKPNDRMTSLERLEIYARCYWYRITESVYDDCPGLRALLGDRKFERLVRAYLTKYPSRYFSLRNLCERLPRFIAEEPEFTAPNTELAVAIAEFEWSQTVAFDGESRPSLTPDDIADAAPARLRLDLQPYITLLDVGWPVDDFVIAVKQRDALRADASNAATDTHRAAIKRVPRPRRSRTCLVVHRYNNRLFYKRVNPEAFAVLTALRAGKPLPQAIAAAGAKVTADQVRDWFATWTELGWLCRREKPRK
jgi:hypothetical protein